MSDYIDQIFSMAHQGVEGIKGNDMMTVATALISISLIGLAFHIIRRMLQSYTDADSVSLQKEYREDNLSGEDRYIR